MTKDKVKRIAHLAGASAVAGWLALGAAQADVLRIGVASAGGGEPVTFGGSSASVLRNQQLLEKAFAGSGTEVQWFFFKGAGPAVNEALSNQQIDFAYEGDLPQVVARANGLDTRLLAALGTRAPIYLAVPKGSGIHSLSDLKGKQVAIFRGTNLHLLAIRVLGTANLTERDLKVVNLDTGSSQAALASKGVDAAFGGYELFKLRDQGIVDLIDIDPAQDPLLTRQTTLLVRSDYAKAHPVQTQKVVDTLVDAARWATDPANRQALFDEFAKSGTPVASWEAEFPGDTASLRLSPLIDEFVKKRYQAVADQAYQQKLIRRPVSVDGWFDTQYLDNALKAKGLQNQWSAYGADGKTPAASTAQAHAQEVQHEPG
ncbi:MULTISPECIES: ABC transporter substrate-binding protein [unclassified Pseudomonas]|uniref:ABC transporter substrate-binding protein n=1 Tax=unclassified Pseudomonas TaxID=196821 RepID=UPI000BCBD62C|nr:MULTISPECIES: ABC transporter substrate-binding protein [unclassified Pseudomonas]PVZ12506.1 sulfonate transport system substrate-binding protein [Pseudomonas sp. URIL14HWK12:I12]PVZ23342.1 sulfonate transport system substrate-binding protein [Pseudomonas sp. URIL14HWK12:I10]PVZ32672.1 sulfonate transport system substrate-binding protein [Pseudomonas sp. URIL14HWK12:I11]SNZ13826.1 sulfonate transport system substrate-binding protein [Pseudomonas sp. URIL14HWK12:I9]